MKTIWFILLTGLLAQAVPAAAEPAAAHDGSADLRRVWVLAQSGAAVFPGSVLPSDPAKVAAYDLICEAGRVRRAERTYLVDASATNGRVWVVRADGADTGSGSLQRALNAVCLA